MADEKHCSLESVIATEQLALRKFRVPDCQRETRIIAELIDHLAQSPQDFFQRLVDAALELSNANSTGISLLDEEQRRFVWPAVAGGLKPYIGGGTPRDFGPCGTVIDRNAPILFLHPERYYTYLTPIAPSLEEVLLIPFYMNDKAVGTLWAVIHQPDHHFDGEDKRLLENLSTFAASAYQVLVNEGILETMLRRMPVLPAAVAENRQYSGLQ
jgi:GAF domain-containing protein